MHNDKIIKNNNKKYENTSLCEPAGSQKESEKVTTIEEKKISKAILIVDDDPDMTSIGRAYYGCSGWLLHYDRSTSKRKLYGPL